MLFFRKLFCFLPKCDTITIVIHKVRRSFNMKKDNSKHAKTEGKKKRINTKLITIIALSILLIASVSYLVYYTYSQWKNKKMMEELANFVTAPTVEENTEG